jgi:hypothetical protein
MTLPVGTRAGRRLCRLGAGLLVVALLSGVGPAVTGAAQGAAAARPTLGQHLEMLAKVGKNYLARLRPEVVKRLSAGGQQLVTLPDKVDELKKAEAAARSLKGMAQGPKALAADQGSDPFAAEDLFSRVAGMTQSETSVGWCDSNAVIGFNDSGSLVATSFLAASPSGSLSFNGWSQSTNAGGSYTDRGALVADPLPAEVMFRDLLGDPVIGCTSASTFYYASLAIDSGPGFAFMNSGISVSRSTDGGGSFGPAIMAASKDANLHFLDKPWMAVEPGPTTAPDDDIIHVSYTDFDSSGLEGQGGPCPDDQRTAIEYVRSTDGGRTWSAPLVMEELCGVDGFLQGSQVEAGVGDDVHVAWEHYSADANTRDIRIRRSADLGATFAPTAVVTPVTPIGDGFVLQGQFRAFLDLQGLAVDRSSGAVYVTFHDGRNRKKPDPLGSCQGAQYCFGDVFLTRSADGGAAWSAPVRINDDTITLGIDQWFPAVDVDRAGTVWVSYHDRRRDARNFLIDTFVAKSTDGGNRWVNSRVTQTAFAPVTGSQDLVVNPQYMGDYIAAASDATGRRDGVIAAWGDNTLGDANVLQRRF